ncbi:hypothetical protein GCM10027290_01820 [Micromonospora sonneratiae]|uniref:TOMM leader peptide-binding protein n=1 Tax=Micromonospora sonneratiae TaxID=1184706 RepID=A0ABW3Y5H4_9ACTN
MRAKLRDDLLYVPVENGVYLETGTGSTEINGGSAYALIQRITPYLDGSNTVDAITAGLPPAQKRLVTDLVTVLVQRGIARDLDSEPPHHLQDWELDRYGQAITFAEHVADAPLHRFERFRNGRVLIIGTGQAMSALVQTLFDLGLRSATLLETAEAPTEHEAYHRVLDRCRALDPTVELHLVPDGTAALATETTLATLFAGYDAVLHCTDRTMADRALTITRVARAQGVPALHAVPTGEGAWVGPTTGGIAGGCWECAVRSARGAGSTDGALLADDRPELRPEFLTPPVRALLGATLGFAYFRSAVGGESSTTNRMTYVDLESAETSEHLLGVHPRCGSCLVGQSPRPIAERVAEMAQRESVDQETFATRVTGLIDRRLGPLLEVGTGSHSQLSVSCLEATVASLTAHGTGPRAVTAVGGNRRQALTRAAVAGLELLAAEAAQSTDVEWWDPRTGETVPAGPDPAAHTVVVAGGFSWAEAQGRALLRLRRAEAPAPASAPGSDAGTGAENPGGRLDRSDWPAAARVMADEMAILGHDLYAWSDVSSTPSVFVGTRSRWLAHACATELDIAVELAMQAAVASLTGRSPDGTDIGPDVGQGSWDTELDPLLAEVVGTGQRLLIRPADQVPALRKVLPFIVEATLVPDAGRIR